jgi:hypothetical protein
VPPGDPQDKAEDWAHAAVHYRLKAYPFDLRDQFEFVSALTLCGKRALVDADAEEIQALSGLASEGRPDEINALREQTLPVLRSKVAK